VARLLTRIASLLAVCSASPALAAAPTARLVYSRASDADSCPEEQALRRAVAARVGYDPFFAWAPRTVVASVARRKKAFVATVDLIDERGIEHGARELRAEGECGELLDAVALAIAIAIDPKSLAAPAESTDVATEQPSAPSAPPPPASPADAPSPEARAEASAQPSAGTVPSSPSSPRELTLEPSLGAVASTGVAPDVAFGVALGAALRWRSFSVAVEGRVDAPASKAASGGGEVSSWLAVAAVVPCAYIGPALVCGVFQGGSMQASGSGVGNAQSRSVQWWAAGGRLGALFHVAGNLSLRARVDVLANLDRATLWLNGSEASRADPVPVSTGVDAVLRFR
jgi:hypothetical protein